MGNEPRGVLTTSGDWTTFKIKNMLHVCMDSLPRNFGERDLMDCLRASDGTLRREKEVNR